MPQNEFNQIWDSSPQNRRFQFLPHFIHPSDPAFYIWLLYYQFFVFLSSIPLCSDFFLSKRAENVGRVSLIGRHLGNAASSHLHNTTHLHIGIFSCASMAVPTSFKMVAHWGFFFHFSWLPPSSLLFPPPSPPRPSSRLTWRCFE